MKLRVNEQAGPVFRLNDVPIYPGDYAVPGDLSEEVAQAVVDAGAGVLVEETDPKPQQSDSDILS